VSMEMHAAAIPFLLLTSATTVATDMLPLVQGIYVEVGVPCKGASNAATVSYWGGISGINDQQTICKINRLAKEGSTYSLQRNCTSVRHGGSFNDRVKVTVFKRTSFTFHGRAAIGTQTTRFRYCGSKVQF